MSSTENTFDATRDHQRNGRPSSGGETSRSGGGLPTVDSTQDKTLTLAVLHKLGERFREFIPGNETEKGLSHPVLFALGSQTMSAGNRKGRRQGGSLEDWMTSHPASLQERLEIASSGLQELCRLRCGDQGEVATKMGGFHAEESMVSVERVRMIITELLEADRVPVWNPLWNYSHLETVNDDDDGKLTEEQRIVIDQSLLPLSHCNVRSVMRAMQEYEVHSISRPASPDMVPGEFEGKV